MSLRESARLRSLLGEALVSVHHIGSTAVPGLPAKPIIDLLPVAADLCSIDDCTSLLEEAGYEAWGEYGLAGRRYFTKDSGGYRKHNLHVYERGHPCVERHIAFCTFLKHHDRLCEEYADLKREVYARHPADIMAYNDGKNAWIKRIEPRAIEWYRQAGLSTGL